MRKATLVALLFFIFLNACKEDDFTSTFPELNQHLIAITTTTEDWEYRTDFVYDSLNRLSEIQNRSQGEQIFTESYVYNEAGKISQKTNGDYTTSYVYNSEGQVIEENLQYLSPENGNEWSTKTEYYYKNGRISKGKVFSENGEVSSYISYKYDSRGNTIEKIVRPSNSDSDFILSELKFRYDAKINPLGASGISTINAFMYSRDIDIVQVNNPVYLSYMNSIASSLPPEFEISYEYSSENLPEKAVLSYVRYPDQQGINVVFEYESIEN
ncbi:hypothetical protein [Maribellus sediminis]|uniref:hypothetical protein n=1 Tax=Maribellus sediminis TaxID=2696285 RepID=UPI00142F9146|nr:hypothetical protein [Maribellus sediminis]